MIARAWAILFAVAACAGNKQVAAPGPVEPTCAAVADHMVAQMFANRVPPPESTITSTKDILRTRCESDAWSTAAKQCLVTMKTEADADLCVAQLTDEQKAALVRDERERRGGKDAALPPPAGQPPPAPDPCQGGELEESDPCQGGE